MRCSPPLPPASTLKPSRFDNSSLKCLLVFLACNVIPVAATGAEHRVVDLQGRPLMSAFAKLRPSQHGLAWLKSPRQPLPPCQAKSVIAQPTLLEYVKSLFSLSVVQAQGNCTGHYMKIYYYTCGAYCTHNVAGSGGTYYSAGYRANPYGYQCSNGTWCTNDTICSH